MESDRCIYFNRRAARPAISSLLHFRPPRSKRSRILENLTLNEKWRWKKLWYRQWECMSFSLILFLSFLSPLSLVKNWSKFSNDKLLTFISLVETETLRNSKTIDRIFPFSFFTILTKIVNARLNRFVLIPFFFFSKIRRWISPVVYWKTSSTDIVSAGKFASNKVKVVKFASERKQ